MNTSLFITKAKKFACIGALSFMCSMSFSGIQAQELNNEFVTTFVNDQEHFVGYPYSKKHSSKNNLVGAWRIYVSPDGTPEEFVNYNIFHHDQTIVGFDTDGKGAVGAYRRKGKKRYVGEFSGPCGCEGFPQGTYNQVSFDANYSKRTQELSGRFITRIISPDGAELAVFQGSIRGEKLGIDPANLP